MHTALEALREITRGVFPAQLARSGLAMAITSLLARTGGGGRLVVDELTTRLRFDPRVESAAYFCVVETMHLGGPVVIALDAPAGQLRVVLTGFDHGGLPLSEMRDRVEAAGGSVSVVEQAGQTLLEVRAPAPVVA